MNISKETALQIIDCLKKALDHADSSIHEARRVLGTEDAAHYRRLVGAVMGNTYLNHIRPLINYIQKIIPEREPDNGGFRMELDRFGTQHVQIFDRPARTDTHVVDAGSAQPFQHGRP